jgi:hypothetical protein
MGRYFEVNGKQFKESLLQNNLFSPSRDHKILNHGKTKVKE